MRQKRARGRGTWAELIFFCLMLVGAYFILALLGFSLTGERGRAIGVYLRERWGGAVIVPLLFWIYLCFAILSRERVPRLVGQLLGTLQLYFSLNFIFGLVKYAGWNSGFALLQPSQSGMNTARFFVLNLGAPGAIAAAILFLLIAAFLFRSRLLLAVTPYIIVFLQKFNAQLNEPDNEDTERRETRSRRSRRSRRQVSENFSENYDYDDEKNYNDENYENYENTEPEPARGDFKIQERAFSLEGNAPAGAAMAAGAVERDIGDININNNLNNNNLNNIDINAQIYKNDKINNFNRIDKNKMNNFDKFDMAERADRTDKNNKIDKINKFDNVVAAENKEIKENQENKVSKENKEIKTGAADILGDLLNSLEAGVFAVPDKLLRPINDDISPDAGRTVSMDGIDNMKNSETSRYDEEESYEDVNADDNKNENYEYDEYSEGEENYDEENNEYVVNQGRIIVETLKNFGVSASVAHIVTGPSVIQFQLALSRGVKVDRLPRFANDLAMALAVMSVRIEAPIPGKHFAGIEIPNPERRVINIDTALESSEFKNNKTELPVIIGTDIESRFIISGLEDIQHLIAAGAAGSGKSVFINNCIMSMCANNSPEKLKLILIDPGRVKFAIYDGLPNLISAPISDPHRAAEVLLWAVNETERRIGLFAEAKVRNLASYNNKISSEKRLARIVIAIDEPSDLMYGVNDIKSGSNSSNSPQSVSELTALLVRKSGAAGIHLIITTQRPSMNLIAEIIKTNIPARAAFKLTSQTESRLFTGFGGAEKLQGRGDMLFISAASEYPLRLQVPFADENRILEFIDFMRKKFGEPNYNYISPEI